MSSPGPSSFQTVSLSRPNTQTNSSEAAKELENSIAGFQAILTDQDRKQLHQLKSTSHDAQSIITFTAELDRLDTSRRGKSVASRLASFLQTIEQFTPIVDTYVQSNPDIAALIWGSIKLTFLLVLLMRRPIKTQVWKAITQSFQAELKVYVEDIRTKAEQVHGEIQLAKTHSDHEEQRLQTKERQAASSHRRQLLSWASKSGAEIKAIEAQRKRATVAEWAFEAPEFHKWLGSDQSSVLHVTGKSWSTPRHSNFLHKLIAAAVGSGKTVLASSIVEKLSQSRPPREFTSFFFIRFDDLESLNSETIIRSCVQQLLSAVPAGSLDSQAASNLVERLERTKTEMFSSDSLIQLYSDASLFVESWSIILDGLDECSAEAQASILKFFSKAFECLPPSRKMRLLFSSRETCSTAIDRTFPDTHRLMAGLHHTSADIAAYARGVVNEKLFMDELVVGDANLVDEILDTIASKEQGMFLWAFLTIEDICSRKTDKEIRQALQEVPADLPTTFNRALGRIMQKRNQEIAKKTFTWTAAVCQPLTLPQLREALSIEVGQSTLRQDDLITGIARLTAWCENLVCVEETNDTVHFSHHSIREFLLTPDSGEFHTFHIDTQICDLLVGEVCITYVNLNNFQTTLTERKRATDDGRLPPALVCGMGGMAEQTVHTAIKGSIGSRMGRLARHVVKSSRSSDALMNGSLPLAEPSPIYKTSEEVLGYPFFDYASKNWFRHTTWLEKGASERTWKLLCQLVLNAPHQSISLPWCDSVWRSKMIDDSSLAGQGAITYGSPTTYLKRHLSDAGKSPSVNLLFAFMYADKNGNWGLAHSTFKLLMEHSKTSNDLRLAVHFLAANNSYMVSLKRCLPLVRRELNHETLVRDVMVAIASGLEYWPPLLETEEAGLPCECAKNAHYQLREDVCKLLSTGYQPGLQPHLRAFALLAIHLEDDIPMTTIGRLCQECQTDAHVLMNAVTSTGKSLMDILLKGLSSSLAHGHSKEMTGFFADFEPPDQGAALRDQNHNIIVLMKQLEEGLDAGLLQVCLSECVNTGALASLHSDTIKAIFFDLVPPFRRLTIANQIVKSVFSRNAKPGSEYILEILFRQSVWTNDWNIAVALLGDETRDLDTSQSRGGFALIRTILSCEWCRLLSEAGYGRTSQPTHYGLCPNHRRMAKKLLDSTVYYEETGTISCSGHPSPSLPRLEDELDNDQQAL
ncbi:hypothetical protein F66182_8175 [Fusarium sp. NRRL 66182]|nr:hypothetical protein F66182_8175 [Fusarium sp. NRRL 66182]